MWTPSGKWSDDLENKGSYYNHVIYKSRINIKRVTERESLLFLITEFSFRAVIVEFAVYNAQTNYFEMVMVVFEFPPGE